MVHRQIWRAPSVGGQCVSAWVGYDFHGLGYGSINILYCLRFCAGGLSYFSPNWSKYSLSSLVY